MALYRLRSWPEPPPELYRNRRRAVCVLVVASVGVAGCFSLVPHLHARSSSSPPLPALFLLSTVITASVLSALFAALYLRALPRRLREVGLQSWELSPTGLVHHYPGKADNVVPADALTGFSIRKSGSTSVRTSEGFTGFFLPPSLADREAFQAELRSMRVPESKPPALLSRWGTLTLLGVFVSLGLLFSHRPLLVLIGGITYLAWMTYAQWMSECRRRPDHSPLTSPLFYLITLLWLFTITLQLYSSLHPRHRRTHFAASSNAVQSCNAATLNTPP